MHLYHYTYDFLVNKVIWNASTCRYVQAAGYPSTVYHAPAMNGDSVWRMDSEPA